MTMMIHTDVRAPIRPRIDIKFGIFKQLSKILVQAHRHSRDAQFLLRANDTLLKDLGVTRVKANGNSYLFSHRSN